ncbi:hypothetical protein HN51_025727 [Arachis hypogaea]
MSCCCSASFFIGTKAMCALARDRSTVWASTHQPCSEVFELMDPLYSLEGGSAVYCRQASEAYEVPVYQSIHFCARHNLAYCQHVSFIVSEIVF